MWLSVAGSSGVTQLGITGVCDQVEIVLEVAWGAQNYNEYIKTLLSALPARPDLCSDPELMHRILTCCEKVGCEGGAYFTTLCENKEFLAALAHEKTLSRVVGFCSQYFEMGAGITKVYLAIRWRWTLVLSPGALDQKVEDCAKFIKQLYPCGGLPHLSSFLRFGTACEQLIFRLAINKLLVSGQYFGLAHSRLESLAQDCTHVHVVMGGQVVEETVGSENFTASGDGSPVFIEGEGEGSSSLSMQELPLGARNLLSLLSIDEAPEKTRCKLVSRKPPLTDLVLVCKYLCNLSGGSGVVGLSRIPSSQLLEVAALVANERGSCTRLLGAVRSRINCMGWGQCNLLLSCYKNQGKKTQYVNFLQSFLQKHPNVDPTVVVVRSAVEFCISGKDLGARELRQLTGCARFFAVVMNNKSIFLRVIDYHIRQEGVDQVMQNIFELMENKWLMFGYDENIKNRDYEMFINCFVGNYRHRESHLFLLVKNKIFRRNDREMIVSCLVQLRLKYHKSITECQFVGFTRQVGCTGVLDRCSKQVVEPEGSVESSLRSTTQGDAAGLKSEAKIPRWGILGEEKTDSSSCLSI